MSATQHPLLSVPFWCLGEQKTIRLTKSDLSCISPASFAETTIRVFVTDKEFVVQARKAFTTWAEHVRNVRDWSEGQ
jgi:hypothetical protein